MLKTKAYKLISCILVLCLLFSACSNNKNPPPEASIIEETDYKSPETTTEKLIDPTRKDYNDGSCYDMTNSVCYLVIFLNDSVSSWTEDEKSQFISTKFLPSLHFINIKAMEYDVKLNSIYQTFNTDRDLTFDGDMEDDVVTNGVKWNLFPLIAAAMGYNSVKKMNSSLKKEFQVDQIAYLVVMNKEGRSYKHSYHLSSSNKIEFCIFFDDSINYQNDYCGSTIAHEILHLFGAEDFYNPYGDLPKRAELSDELYPNDIMNHSYSNINDAEIGAFTAYTVGWSDKLPEECNVPEWWQ